MKPDGKIQGVDVFIEECRINNLGWYIHRQDGASRQYLRRDGDFHVACGNEGFWPSREAALAHLRQLEAKERPVVDLTTAKFGDKFKRGDGKIETYACPQEGKPGWHIMQTGDAYRDDGTWDDQRSNLRYLVAPYTPPRTVEVWIEVYEIGKGELYAEAFLTKEDFAEGIKATKENGFNTILTFHKTLTEGEGLAEPDVA